MSLLTLLLYGLWLLRTARAVASATALWQQKEYRWDRFRAHWELSSTHRRFLSPLELAKWAALMIALVQPDSTAILLPLLILTYGGESLLLIREVNGRRVQRPTFTARALLLMAAGLGAASIVGVGANQFLDGAPAVGLLLSDRLVLVLVTLFVLLLHPVFLLAKRRIVRRARAHRATLAHLTVVGITGSYGKSSTKEFLSVLLGNGADVLKTPGNTNTEIGVAQVVLARLRPEQRVFLCEMGAYRRGEIRRIADIVRPSIGVLTAVAPQHLALFGSLEEIRDTKYELIQALPPTGTAIVSADDPICRELAGRTTHCRVVRYGRHPSAAIRAESVRADARGISARLVTPEGSRDIAVPLLGEHHIGNVLGSISAALALGVSLDTVVSRLRLLRPPPRTMEPITLTDHTVVIDDSYSANPEGVLAAIRVLSLFPQQQKLVILAPMIELGQEAASAHRKVGEALRGVATRVFLTERDFANDLQHGMGTGHGAPTLTLLHRKPRASARGCMRGGYPAKPWRRGVPCFGRVPLHGKARNEATAVKPWSFTVEPRSEGLEQAVSRFRGSETVILLEGRVPMRFWERLIASREIPSHSTLEGGIP